MAGPQPCLTTPALLLHHREELHRSGISDETILRNGIYSETVPDKVRGMLGMKLGRGKSESLAPAMVFRFTDLQTGELNGHFQLKPDTPRLDRRKGKPIKYESPAGERNRLYASVGMHSLLADPTGSLIVTEGIKKQLAAFEKGYACVGLIGVMGWKDKGKEWGLPDFNFIALKVRTVYICFDSDAATNDNVLKAERRLAKVLVSMGAVVKIVRLPQGPEKDEKPTKVGLDDFLVAHGVGEFAKLIEQAQPPEPVEGEAEKVPAECIDAMEEAKKFIDLNGKQGGELKLRAWRGRFHYYGGKSYKEQDDAYVDALVWKYLDVVAKRINRGTVANLLAAIRALTIVPAERAQPTWLDGRGDSKNFIAMSNGIVELAAVLAGGADVLRPHSPLWFSAICLPYGFDPAAACPTWEASISRGLEGDEARIAVFQEFCGYCLMPDTSLQKFLLMTGEGGTGKSSACAGLTAMLGTANVSHLGLEMFGQRFQMFQTLGKLANICFDSGDFDKTAEGALKSFTSGDPMPFERKYEDTIDAVPTARLVLATNNLPRFSDRTTGIWRRMILLPFRRVVSESEKVPGMDKTEWWEASGELPGIFNWAVRGLERLRRQGRFTKSDVCETELNHYRAECNPAGMFLRDHFEADAKGDIVTQDTYSEYVAWSGLNGYRALASNTFGKEIVRAFPNAQAKKVHGSDGRRVPGYVGIKKASSADGAGQDGGF